MSTLSSAENEIRVEMTIANQCTGEQNHPFPFLIKKFKQNKIAFIFSMYLFLTIKYYRVIELILVNISTSWL